VMKMLRDRYFKVLASCRGGSNVQIGSVDFMNEGGAFERVYLNILNRRNSVKFRKRNRELYARIVKIVNNYYDLYDKANEKSNPVRVRSHDYIRKQIMRRRV
jgi:hypothetical protein